MKNPLIVFTGAALATLAALAGLKMTDWPADAPPASNATEAVSEQPKTGGTEAEKPADKPAEVAAVQPTETPKAETPTPAAPAKPELDTVRVEADGQAIVAGRAQPGAEVSLKLGDQTLGKGVANSDGAWVVVPDSPLPKGAHELTVEQKAVDGSTSAAEKSIAVAVPEQPGQQAMVALTEPGTATKVLQAGGGTEQPAAAAQNETPAETVLAEKPAEPTQAEQSAEPVQQTAEVEPTPQPAPATEQAPAAETAAAPAGEQPAGETVQKTAEAPATGETVQKTTETPATAAAPEQPAESAGAGGTASQTQEETAALETPAAEPSTAVKPAETAAPKPTDTPAKPAKVALRLDAVDYNDKGDIIFSGRAQPGTAVRLYVDNGPVGDAIVDSQGNWSFAGNDIIKPGTHALRADQIDSGGKVVARIELPFQREDAAAVAALNAPAQPEPQPEPQPAPQPQTTTEAQPAPQPAEPEGTEAQPAPQPTEAQPAPQSTEVAKAEPEAVAPSTSAPAAEQPAAEETPQDKTQEATAAAPSAEPEAQPTEPETKPAEPETQAEAKPAEPDKPRSGKVVIQPGNNLWKLSRVIYGRGINFTVIYDANKGQIRDPDLIYPGQIFAIPNATPPEQIDPKRREPLTSAEGGAAQ